MSLSEDQIERYSRQIILKEIGGVGQATLLDSTVFILGAGGLGSPAALYLAAAGIGHLVIADSDRVELSNLQRQILHTTDRVGEAKVVSAEKAIRAINPDINVTTISERITEQNVGSLLAGSDLVLDGSDNFPTRYLLNEACLSQGKRLVSAAVLGFEGQIATFSHGVDPNSPCYRCLFPSPPEFAPTCSSAGVLGAVVGMLGTLQAAEAVKVLLGIGQGLSGSMLLINILDNIFHRITIPKLPDCPTCGGG
jgi:molybdopterin-synthase adenylyltransferase